MSVQDQKKDLQSYSYGLTAVTRSARPSDRLGMKPNPSPVRPNHPPARLTESFGQESSGRERRSCGAETPNGSDGTEQSGENCIFPCPARGDMSLECIEIFKSSPTPRLFRGKPCMDRNAPGDWICIHNPIRPKWARRYRETRSSCMLSQKEIPLRTGT